jgi:hypothetical protein
MGLHAYFVLHSDDFIKVGGRYAAVLPAALFNSDYGEGIKQLLVEKYDIEYFVASDAHVNFSEGCNWKEVLLVAQKSNPTPRDNSLTKFAILKEKLTLTNADQFADTIMNAHGDYENEALSIVTVSKEELRDEANWMAFTKPILLDTIRKIKRSPVVRQGQEVLKIREGLVLVSPDFFFLPNKHWEIATFDKKDATIWNKSTSQKLKIPIEFLQVTTRKPELHTKISPALSHFVVAIPPKSKLSPDVKEYIKYGEALQFKRQPSPREKVPYIITYCQKKGIPWHSYVWSDLQSRKARGHIGLVEKFRVKTRPCIAHYFDEITTGSNNYSFGTTNNKTFDKVLVAWFNSSIFLSIFLAYKREIAGDYSRWKIADLNRYPCIFPQLLDNHSIEEICHQLDGMRDLQLPPFPAQLGKSPRKELDEALLKALKVDDARLVLDNMYHALKLEIDKLR